MKYIKKYESTEYNVGDIVRVRAKDDDTITFTTKKFVDSNPGEILSNNNSEKFPYRIDFIDMIPNSKKSTFIFSEDEILRKATDEEIELFKTKKDANKYNL